MWFRVQGLKCRDSTLRFIGFRVPTRNPVQGLKRLSFRVWGLGYLNPCAPTTLNPTIKIHWHLAVYSILNVFAYPPHSTYVLGEPPHPVIVV